MLIPPPQAASHAEKMRVSLIWMNDPQIITYMDIFTKKFTSGIISVSSRGLCIFSCLLVYPWGLPFPPWLPHIMSIHKPLWRAYTQAFCSSRDSHFPHSTSCLYASLLQGFKEMAQYNKWTIPSLTWEESTNTHSVCLANTSIISNVLSQCINSIELFKERFSIRIFTDSTDISLGIAHLKLFWRMLMTYMLSTC